jgi:outer membrane receptor protein involved in Fe transport
MSFFFRHSAIGAAVFALLCGAAAAQQAPSAPPSPPAAAAAQTAPAASGADANGDAGADGTLSTVEVKEERSTTPAVSVRPQTGSTVYHIDSTFIDSLAKGDATSFDDVLMTLPGVSKDSKASGSLHVRDDHANVQYRINGIQLPDQIAGFGQSLDTRYVQSLDFLTGVLPAEYGLRTAGVVDIQTKEGFGQPGGSLGIGFGSHNQVLLNGSVFGTKGNLSYYFSGSAMQSDQGIENPQPTVNALHDQTRQGSSFGNLSYYLDDDTRIGLMFGTYNGRYQIPNNPHQVPAWSLAGFSDLSTGFNALPSAYLDENQTEENRFVALSYQKTLGALQFQVSLLNQYSNLHFEPDNAGDLIYNGVASNVQRSNSANTLQLDGTYKLDDAHTLGFGAAYTHQSTQSINSVGVFALDDLGAQLSTYPTLIADNSSKIGHTGSLYAQDSWKIDPKLTLNYGLRYDTVDAFTDEHQWSPRVTLAYLASDATAFHAGVARYFTPPPQELASQQSINLYTGTSNQPEVPFSDAVKSERTTYYDIGASHLLTPSLTLTADAYYKDISNLLDEGQFGQALILSPFNYAQGFARGLELSARYNKDNWSGYANFAYQKAMGKNIVSGQSLFGAAELAYIANHYVYLDHNQTYTASAGASYRMGSYQLNGDLLYGSGMRATPVGGVPNGASLPDYTVVNLSLVHTWKEPSGSDIEGRIALLNLFDKVYLLRDGTGIGVGAPQYGPRRTFYVSMTTHF